MAKIHDLVQAACKTSDLKALKSLEIEPMDLMSVDLENRTPLMIAASYGKVPIIKYLDDKAEELLGYDIYKVFTIRDNNDCSPLSVAAKNGHIEAVVTLYELGAYDSFTAKIADWIIFANMSIDSTKDEHGIAQTLQKDAKKRLAEIYRNNLYNVVKNPQAQVMEIRRAITNIGDVNAIVYDEHPALYHAVIYGNVTAVKILLEEGARVAPDMIPLALDSKNDEVISLLGQFVPLNAKAINWGYLLDILLDHAIKANDANVAVRLLPNMTMKKLQEALIYSAEVGSIDVLKCLLKHGVDVNSTEDSHRTRTAAMLAAKRGRVNVLKLLIDNGANLHLRSEHGIGLTALDYAKIYGRKNCQRLILESLALEKYGNTALNRAAAHGELDTVLAGSKDEASLNVALDVAKETKQPASFIRELKKYLNTKFPRSKVFSFNPLAKLKAKK